MHTVLILGYGENLLGQVLREYLQFYGGQWAEIYCSGICDQQNLSPFARQILNDDNIPTHSTRCLDATEIENRYWDFVICPKPIDPVHSHLSHLKYGKVFSFDSTLPLMNGSPAAYREELERKVESLKKRILVFIGREFLREQKPLETWATY
jgi:hypothetical protein